MNSIDALESDIKLQISQISKIKKNSKIAKVNIDNSIFVGTGDSYVSAYVTQYISNFRTFALDPYEIIMNPYITKNKDVYFISVSGSTSGNIKASKIARTHCNKTIAVTANPKSELALNCDEIIHLDYHDSSTTTSGTISFLFSTLTCTLLIKPNTPLSDISNLFSHSNQSANNIIKKQLDATNLSNEIEIHSSIFLGNLFLYPLAIYASLKIYEIFGMKSYAYSLENFCHAPIFNINKNDLLFNFKSILTSSRKDLQLINLLNKNGYHTYQININSKSDINIIIETIFFIQLYMLKLAKLKNIKECYFLNKKDLLDISSKLIYS